MKYRTILARLALALALVPGQCLADDWKQLFNGRDLTGWKHVGPGGDTRVTDYTEDQPVPPRKFDFEPQRGPRPLKGWIGLQNHSDNNVVFFKEVAIKALEKK